MSTAIDAFRGEYQFLSNFYFHNITWEQIVYPTVEHAFQAAKTLDMGLRLEMSQRTSPMDLKRRGRRVPLRPGWDAVRLAVMAELIIEKFPAGSELAERLLATGTRPLVEGNTWHDNIWGTCVCGAPACRAPGRNQLGTTLMWRRARLTGRGPDLQVFLQQATTTEKGR